MNGKCRKFAKKPINPENLESIVNQTDKTYKDDVKMSFLLMLMYFGFLRVSEAVSLTKGNITIKEGSMEIQI
ncbi:hypothetical protein TRFO_16640 [Tritrichomonas foetus]|uniref:Tyr recombinase domain-containing protein n=1 Tax=Tritrichomonas foetus TaxID=1144522 RepID=A0A1J4KPY8_9EUKA|nr:hypothetical protein TRFO_16640 [Tritrichomonas foetus]|eukprot:OHT13307.1 hypothetical protein TRFO_16640 [Tritrichomonas foetus]